MGPSLGLFLMVLVLLMLTHWGPGINRAWLVLRACGLRHHYGSFTHCLSLFSVANDSMSHTKLQRKEVYLGPGRASSQCPEMAYHIVRDRECERDPVKVAFKADPLLR